MPLPSPIILASASPRRKALMHLLGQSFIVHPSSVDESTLPHGEPIEYATQLAMMKASAVKLRFDRGVVVGADTIVVHNGSILNKPVDRTDAIRMLSALSGKTHQVHTGLAVLDCESSAAISTVETTNVTFRALDADEIERYVASGSPLDKAGAYGIQDDAGAIFIERIDGCYYNVVGLPLTRLYITLRDLRGAR